MLKRFFFRTIILAFVLAGHFTGLDGFINVAGFFVVFLLTPCATLFAFSDTVQRKLADTPKAPDVGGLDSFVRTVIRGATVMALAWFGHFLLGALYLWSLMCFGAGSTRTQAIRRDIAKTKAKTQTQAQAHDQACNGSEA